MNHEESITKITKLDLNLQCKGEVYVIIAMHIYLLKELHQLETVQEINKQQIMPIKG